MPDSSPQSPENAAAAPPAGPDNPPASPAAVAIFAPALPGRLEGLAETARDYAKASSSANTSRAYAADWRHYLASARRQAPPALPPDPQILGLYIAAQASGADSAGRPSAVSTIERRLSALAWHFAQR